MTQDDPELGLVRWCERCKEWWPDDEEFWRYYRLRAGGITKVVRGTVYRRRNDSWNVRCRACYAGLRREQRAVHA